MITNKELAIGLMSGTSLDGLDVALVELTIINEQLEDIHLLQFETFTFSKGMQKELLALALNQANVRNVCNMNFKFAQFCAKTVNDFLLKNKIKNKNIKFIASHGQTIFHLVNDLKVNETKSTLQIGDGNVIANLTNIDTVSDFRTADLSVGGQGAPLVCFYDLFLAKKYQTNFIFQNIGGIANATITDWKNNHLIAFDNGPGNMMINYLSNHFFKKKFDNNGSLAKKGNINEPLLKDLLQDKYYQKLPPKSTGREKYSEQYIARFLLKYQNLSPHDILRTFTFLTAKTIVDSYVAFANTKSNYKLVITGGGYHNKLLISDILALLPDNIKIIELNQYQINADAKEAVAFAMLGYCAFNKIPANLLEATGAYKKVVLGKIAYARSNN